MGRTVDVHHHAIPSGLCAAIHREGERFGAEVKPGPQDSQLVTLPDGSRMMARRVHQDPAMRQRELTEAGIEVGLESVLPLGLWYEADGPAAEWYARMLNDAIQ